MGSFSFSFPPFTQQPNKRFCIQKRPGLLRCTGFVFLQCSYKTTRQVQITRPLYPFQMAIIIDKVWHYVQDFSYRTMIFRPQLIARCFQLDLELQIGERNQSWCQCYLVAIIQTLFFFFFFFGCVSSLRIIDCYLLYQKLIDILI